MPSIEIDQTQFEYHEEGSGEPLILVHGSASDHRTWHHQRDVFAEEFRVMTYSRRYHWPNEPIKEGVDYYMPEQVEDLQKFLNEMNAAPAHLAGHSYGAFLCLLLAMKEPELVRSLILAEPPILTLFVSNTPKLGQLLKLLFTRPRTTVAIIRFGAKGFSPARTAAKKDNMDEAMEVFGRAVLGDEFYEQLSDSRREQIKANTIKTELIGSGFVPLDAKEITKVEVPALLINGEQSPAFFHRLMDGLEELLPDTDRRWIEEASHIMHEDNPAAYNEAVLTFLRSHS